jgi:beta-glucanase (GH16 family)
MSDVKDEIDFEMVGAFPKRIESNVFYRGITEYAIHSKKLDIDNGTIDQWHTYTIDWRHDRITWLIDGQPKHKVWKWNSTSAKIPPSERWFPTTPSKVQISVWEAPISDWSGGRPVDWKGGNTLTAKYGYIDIICYDQNDKPVQFGL